MGSSFFLHDREHPPLIFVLLQQIHGLIMALNYTGIEIRSAHSLESWNAGVLVMVSGSVQLKDFTTRRKFAQTFFLAPQEKGYFVLNDIFQFLDDERILHHHHHQAAMLAQSNLDSNRSPEPGIISVIIFIFVQQFHFSQSLLSLVPWRELSIRHLVQHFVALFTLYFDTRLNEYFM